ncbi:MAG: hypothetical protein ACJAYU_002880 [Bradymonadia bacterium]|jgi:hypothetical protein
MWVGVGLVADVYARLAQCLAKRADAVVVIGAVLQSWDVVAGVLAVGRVQMHDRPRPAVSFGRRTVAGWLGYAHKLGRPSDVRRVFLGVEFFDCVAFSGVRATASARSVASSCGSSWASSEGSIAASSPSNVESATASAISITSGSIGSEGSSAQPNNRAVPRTARFIL